MNISQPGLQHQQPPAYVGFIATRPLTISCVEVIDYEPEAENKAMLGGEIKVDKSYFGDRRKGKRGRGAAGKIPVFLKRGGKVYSKVISGLQRHINPPIIERKVSLLLGVCFAKACQPVDSIVYSNCWRGYNVLAVSDFTPFRINHSRLFASHNRINGIENFWNQTKCYMRKFSGVPNRAFWVLLKGM